MHGLVFATSNDSKFKVGQEVCREYGIVLAQQKIEIDEIQGEDPEKIARDKAAKSFEKAKRPVLVSDDSWAFLGLNGFPGAYMHSMNEWFGVEDFLNLTRPLTDRRAVFTQFLIYKDFEQEKIFQQKTSAQLLTEARGQSKQTSHRIISLAGDDGRSIAEVYQNNQADTDRAIKKVWHQFAKWYKGQ